MPDKLIRLLEVIQSLDSQLGSETVEAFQQTLGDIHITIDGDLSGNLEVAHNLIKVISQRLEMPATTAAMFSEVLDELQQQLGMARRTKGIFLSYAWADDQPFVQRLYEELTQRGYSVWWDRADLASRGSSILQELRDAMLKEVDRIIPIVGPAALTSQNVQYEWETARQTCKVITPILRMSTHDDLPPDFRAVKYFDFRDDAQYEARLQDLFNTLETPVNPLGTLYSVPALPPHFLPRSDYLDQISQQMLIDVQQATVITSQKQTTALQGMGGIGKSVLAAAFARQCETRRAFSDGIFWLTIGQEPEESRLISHMRAIGVAFGDDPSKYVDLTASAARLGEVLKERTCLLVLDDVWGISAAAAFRNALGVGCRLLVTTRDGSIAQGLTGSAEQAIRLKVLIVDDALALLAQSARIGVEQLPHPQAGEIADECGNLPLALALCGAMAGAGTAWQDILQALQDADLAYLARQFPDYPYPDVLKALDTSVVLLEKQSVTAAAHYRELAVFPSDTAIPESAIVTLWVHTNGLNAREARQLITDLNARNLITTEGDSPVRLVTLHDLQHDYLRVNQQQNLQALHQMLLEAHQTAYHLTWWQDIPTSDAYLWTYLSYHLVQAGQTDILRELLLNYNWLKAKIDTTSVYLLIQDFNVLPLADHPELKLIQGALWLSSHVLMEHGSGQLRNQLYGRLGGFENQVLRQFCAALPDADLALTLPTLIPPGGPLVRTLIGHTSSVTSVIIPNESFALSASGDNTLKLWDLATGKEVYTLTGHTGVVTGVTIAPNAVFALSASNDGSLKLWDLTTQKEIRTLTGHTGEIADVVLTPDGRFAVSASADNTLKLWDLVTGKDIHTLVGHTSDVTSVAVTSDGRYAVSASRDRTLRVWDLAMGLDLYTLKGHTLSIYRVVVTPDGRFAVSASGDNSLKAWDLSTGREVHTLKGHKSYVSCVIIMPDGASALSASGDCTLKLWDLATGREVYTLKGHTGEVTDVTLTPDKRSALSASKDNTLRLWDLASGQESLTLEGHTSNVTTVAVTQDGRYALSGSSDGTLKVWGLATWQEVHTLKDHTLGVTSVTVTPDGRYALSGSSDGTLKVWELATQRVVHTLKEGTSGITSVTVTPDGRYALTNSDDSTVRVWDLITGQKLHNLERHTFLDGDIVVSPDGRFARSVSSYKTWDLATGEEQKSLIISSYPNYLPDRKRVTSDGRFTFVTSKERIDLSDSTTGQNVRSITPVPTGVSVWDLDLAISLDGRFCVIASDGSLQILDYLTLVPIASFWGDSGISCCAMGPDSLTVVAGDEGGMVHFLRWSPPSYRGS